MSRLFTLACAGAIVLVGIFAWLAPSRHWPPAIGRSVRDRAPAVDAIARRKHQLLAAAANRAADPELEAMYTDINERHFGGLLPPAAVKWEENLDELSSLAGQGYKLEGLTDGKTILVSAALNGNIEELRRTLCHEAVHVKLREEAAAVRHDAKFQQELRHVFESGCFQAVLASDAEQAGQKQWLDAESARIKTQSASLDAARADLDREVSEINDAVLEMNARMAAANARHSGWPSDEEREALVARQARARERNTELNAAIDRHNAESADLAQQVERYRLMLAYPRGVDDTLDSTKPPGR